MATKKKSKKQDPKLVSKEKYEVNYIHKKYKIPIAVVKQAHKEAGRSRAKCYAWLRQQGYNIPTRKK